MSGKYTMGDAKVSRLLGLTNLISAAAAFKKTIAVTQTIHDL